MRRDKLAISPTELAMTDLDNLRDALDALLRIAPSDDPVWHWVVNWRNEFEWRVKLQQSRRATEVLNAQE